MTVNRLGLGTGELQDFAFIRTLAYAEYGAASVGEVTHVARKIAEAGGGREAYVRAWAEQGRKNADRAREALAAGRTTTARTHFHRAYNYLRAAEFYFDRRRPAEAAALYDESVACFDQALPLLGTPAERLRIPYGDGPDLPGYLFAAADDGVPRPTVVIWGGGDGHGEELYFLAGVPEALARGLNVVLFHGPGQRGLLHHHPGQVMRADAEVPLGAVLDHVAARPEVRPDRIALYGLSFGGYLAPRAAAFDRRVAALVANAPILDFHEAIMDAVTVALPAPPPDAPDDLWDEVHRRVATLDWALAATIDNYLLWTTGAASLGEFLRLTRAFALGDLVGRITVPVLSISSDGESPVQRAQAAAFHERLDVPRKRFHRLAVADGADAHCGVNNIALTSSIAYDWLAEALAG